MKDAKKDDKKDDKKAIDAKDLIPYGDREREALTNSIPGAIYKLTLDNTHPLAFGMPKYYYSLKLSDDLYEYLGDGGWNVGIIKKGAYQAGFVGQKTLTKLNDGMLLGVQNAGRGTVIYMADDPLFRDFGRTGNCCLAMPCLWLGSDFEVGGR